MHQVETLLIILRFSHAFLVSLCTIVACSLVNHQLILPPDLMGAYLQSPISLSAQQGVLRELTKNVLQDHLFSVSSCFKCMWLNIELVFQPNIWFWSLSWTWSYSHACVIILYVYLENDIQFSSALFPLWCYVRHQCSEWQPWSRGILWFAKFSTGLES